MEVTLEEVSNVIRLVREVCDLWDDPRAWRKHLLEGACRLLHGHAGIILEDDVSGAYGYFGNLCVTTIVGLPETMRSRVQPAISQLSQRKYEDVSENMMAGVSTLWEHIRAQGWVTVAGNQISDEAAYHASPFYQNFRKQIDSDDFVVSIRIVDLPQRPEAILIDRRHGADAFTSHDVSLLKLLHDEIAPLVGVRLATEEHLCRDGLSKRLRETLSLLLEGQSEKQVATALDLGTRTVHDYVCKLYEHFCVSSRAELLAYFVQRTPQLRAEQLS